MRDTREDLRGVLEVVPHPACQPYRLSGPNVHLLALAYNWLVICLWAEPTQTQSTILLQTLKGSKTRCYNSARITGWQVFDLKAKGFFTLGKP